MELDSIIGEIYDASSNDGNWLAVGKRLFGYLGAEAGSLRIQASGGGTVNVFEARPASDQYSEHYLRIDPVRAAFCRPRPSGKLASAVLLDDELVDREEYRRTEFYHDFARPNGQDHMIVGIVGDDDQSIVGFYRHAAPFGTRERATLSSLLPHVRRALQLRQKLQRANFDARLGYAVFDALPGAAVVFDSDCNVLFANSSATKMFTLRDRPLRLTTAPTSGTKLVIDHRGDASRLRAMIRNVANGGAGGAMRIEFEANDSADRVGQYGIFVSPHPGDNDVHSLAIEGHVPVLILINELSRPQVVKPSLFSELFGLSAAEGAVAAALLGGQSAETVARERAVSLDTVRTQIRTVLRKSNAANLRDFERIGALLGSLRH